MGNNLGVDDGTNQDPMGNIFVNGMNYQDIVKNKETKKKFHIQSLNKKDDIVELNMTTFKKSFEERSSLPLLGGKYYTDIVDNFIVEDDSDEGKHDNNDDKNDQTENTQVIKHNIKQYRVLLNISGSSFFITYAIEYENKFYGPIEYNERELNEWIGLLYNQTTENTDCQLVVNNHGRSFDRITQKDNVNVIRKVYLNDSPKDDFTKSWAPNLHFMQALGCPIPPPTCACCERTRLVEPLSWHTVYSTSTTYSFKIDDVWIKLCPTNISLNWTTLGHPPNDIMNTINYEFESKKMNFHFGNLFDILGLYSNTYVSIAKGLYFKNDTLFNNTKFYYPTWVNDDTIWSNVSGGYSGTNELVEGTNDYWYESDCANGAIDYTNNQLVQKIFNLFEIIGQLVENKLVKDKTPHPIDVYNYGTLTEPAEDFCAICYEKENSQNGEWIKLNNCVHKFHTNCVESYVKDKCCCPYCKTLIQMSGDKYDSLVPLSELIIHLNEVISNVDFSVSIKELINILKTSKYEDFNKFKNDDIAVENIPENKEIVTNPEFLKLYEQYTNKITISSEHTFLVEQYKSYKIKTILNNQLLEYTHNNKDLLIDIATSAWNKPIVYIPQFDNNTQPLEKTNKSEQLLYINKKKIYM